MYSKFLAAVPSEWGDYNLTMLFDAAVEEQQKQKQEYDRYCAKGSELGSSMYGALLSRATRLVDVLQDFKNAGHTHVKPKHPFPTNGLFYNLDHDVLTQFENGLVKPLTSK